MAGLSGRIDVSDYKLMDAPLRMSLAVSNRVDFTEVVQKRRRNYLLWLEKLEAHKGVKRVFKDLPDGVCPLFFPVVAHESEPFFAEMEGKGVVLSRWPPLPGEVKDNGRYRVANFMAEHLFILPVHQYLESHYLKSMVF